MAPPRLLLGRFIGKTPLTLFRIQSGAVVRLRPEAVARAAGRTSFDIVENSQGCVLPRDPAEALFMGPNGMSMRPEGSALAIIFASFRGKGRVFEVPAGTPIPAELVLLHEHSDHYALQPAEAMTLKRLNSALTSFLSQPTVRLHLTSDDFYSAHPSMHPSVVGFSENA
jgi:hypothetical protein